MNGEFLFLFKLKKSFITYSQREYKRDYNPLKRFNKRNHA
jgi:hypothetical protein